MSNNDMFPCECRKEMVEDLTHNHKLIGLKQTELIELLGPPDSGDSTFVSYELIVDYGSDIDPVYTKTLTFDLNPKTVVKSYRIVEWKK